MGDFLILDYRDEYPKIAVLYILACGKPACHRQVAPRECAVHPRWKPEREAEEKRRRRQSRKTEAACRKCLP